MRVRKSLGPFSCTEVCQQPKPLRKFPNSGRLYQVQSDHPRAPVFVATIPVEGRPYAVRIWCNRGCGENGTDAWTIVLEAQEAQ